MVAETSPASVLPASSILRAFDASVQLCWRAPYLARSSGKAPRPPGLALLSQRQGLNEMNWRSLPLMFCQVCALPGAVDVTALLRDA